MKVLPLVAIVGAPNVGKSTLFNRLVRRRAAIVTDEPGVTRDRHYGTVDAGEVSFRLVDTGGLTPEGRAPFAHDIERQAEAALAESALVLFVVDIRSGITASDRDVAAWLRKRRVKVVVVANKSDDAMLEAAAHEAQDLGLGEPCAVSAEHGLGIGALLDRVVAVLDVTATVGPGSEADGTPPIAVAIVGRPNVGKSSIVNRLIGAERSIVSEIAGTTRDAVDTLLEAGGRRFLLIDTAGLRRRGSARRTAESLAVVMAHRSIERADVVVLVIDAQQPFAAQDAHVAGFAHDAAKPVVIVLNKWDLVASRDEAARTWSDEVKSRLRFVKEAPVILVSALTGQRVPRILDAVADAYGKASIRVPTPDLNRWLHRAARDERSSPAGGRSIRLFYATQTGIRPLRFVLFCSDARRVHFSLRRQLENGLRETFGLGCAPVRLTFRSRREAGTR